MARLDLTPQLIISKYPATPLDALAAAFTWTAAGADFVDGAAYPLTGREVLLVRNDNAGQQTITISSVADEYARTGDIDAYAIPAAGYAVFPSFPKTGWAQPNGKLYFAASAADVNFAVLRLSD